MAADPSRLYTALLNTGLQQKDNALYQVMYDLIRQFITLNNQVNKINIAISPGAPGSIGQQGIQGIQGIPGSDGEDGEILILKP